MIVQWTDELSTGVSRIDQQHKELIETLKKLLDACNQGKGKSEVEQIIQFLCRYVNEHFETEEYYMDKYAYPGTADQKAAHAQFRKNLESLKAQFAQEGPALHMVVTVNRVLMDWLINHIKRSDKVFGEFLKPKLK